MAEKEPEQEFNAEDFKNLLRAGLATLRQKSGKLFSKVSHEINPDVRVEKYLQRKLDQLRMAGLDPEHAKKVVQDHIDKLLK